jgi:[acyl-carrier-protein] S-malonyltransferase
MQPAAAELKAAIDYTNFSNPICPIFQNVDAKPTTEPSEIKEKLIEQLTASVRWTQIVENMISSGASSFTEIGPGNVLQGLVKKVDRKIQTYGFQ